MTYTSLHKNSQCSTSLPYHSLKCRYSTMFVSVAPYVTTYTSLQKVTQCSTSLQYECLECRYTTTFVSVFHDVTTYMSLHHDMYFNVVPMIFHF